MISLSSFYFLFFVFLLAVLLFSLFFRRSKQQGLSYKYKKIDLLTPAESVFYHFLLSRYSHRYLILSKVRVADLIKPDCSSKDRSAFFRMFNQIAQKHVDFVIIDKDTFSVICAVELNDSSHKISSRANRDQFLYDSFNSATLPLVFVKCARSYSSASFADIDSVLSFH